MKRLKEQAAGRAGEAGPDKPENAQGGGEDSGSGLSNPPFAHRKGESNGSGPPKAASGQPGKKIGAGFSGVFVGTVMTYFSSRIDDAETKKFVLLSIPTVSISVSGGMLKTLRWYHKQLLEKRIAKLREVRDEKLRKRLADPMLSNEKKKQAQKEYDDSMMEANQDDKDTLSVLLAERKALNGDAMG